MKKRNIVVGLLMGVTMMALLSGCTSVPKAEDPSVYLDPAQENAADKEEVVAYAEEVKPLIESFYEEGKGLKNLSAKGNALFVEVDLSEVPGEYDKVEDQMIFESTRITHGLLNYRPYEFIKDLYKISITFTGGKTLDFYGKQMVGNEGELSFKAETIVAEVKRK